MGLRVEQHNIEDLLKYFVARNEFKRKNLLKILEDLTPEEQSKLKISNYAEFYNYYRFLYKVLRQDITEGTKTTLKNHTDLIGRSHYTEDFLLKYPFQYILDLRNIEYTNEEDSDELFQKIINSNPDNTSEDLPILITSQYEVANNLYRKIKLNDLSTFTAETYYTSDKDEEGLTEKTKAVIILAALRKILDEREIPYKESDYLIDVVSNGYVIDSYNLTTDTLLELVLNTNPLTVEELPDGKEETFRTLQSEMNSLKAFVNDYVVNETKYSDNKYFMKNGRANYSGYKLCTTIPHNTGLMPANIIINNVNPESIADTGDVYVKSDNKNIYVYNTGKNRSEFEFTIIFDTGDYLEFPKDRTFKDFVEIANSAINRVTINNSKVTIEKENVDDEIGKLKSVDLTTDGGTLFNSIDFLIVTKADTSVEYKKFDDFYYPVGDESLFKYEDGILTVIGDIEVSDEDTFSITAIKTDDAPIYYLLTTLMMEPNYYIQKVLNFPYLLRSIGDLSDAEVLEYAIKLNIDTSDGSEEFSKFKQNTDIRFIDLTDYNITRDDILFINGLAYSMSDPDHFELFYITSNETKINEETGETEIVNVKIDKRILTLYNFKMDNIDNVYVSRLAEEIIPFDIYEESDDPTSSYMFDKYTYLTANSSFGHHSFKSDLAPNTEDDEAINLDPSSRLYNNEPLTDRIEGLDLYNGLRHAIDSKIEKQERYAIVPHKLGKTPNFININPIITSETQLDESKVVGNIWWTADDENIYVYNSGDSTCEFEWFAAYEAKEEKYSIEEYKYDEVVSFDKSKCLFYNITHSTDDITNLNYYGNDYIQYDKDAKRIIVKNTNENNKSHGYKLSYFLSDYVSSKKFLEYAPDFTSNQDGYFDKDPNSQPNGSEILNYSGELRAARFTAYGNGIVQYLPIEDRDQFKAGDIVSYVDGVCKLADSKNLNTVIGIVVDPEEIAIAIDDYYTFKVPVALFGIHKVKVVGEIKAGDKLGLVTDIVDLKGVASSADSYVNNCYIGKALEDYNNINNVGTIKVLISIA